MVSRFINVIMVLSGYFIVIYCHYYYLFCFGVGIFFFYVMSLAKVNQVVDIYDR